MRYRIDWRNTGQWRIRGEAGEEVGLFAAVEIHAPARLVIGPKKHGWLEVEGRLTSQGDKAKIHDDSPSAS